MKRGFGYVSVTLGLFLLLLVPLLLLYAVPRLRKAPTDTDQTVVSNGSATYFSAAQLQLLGPSPVQNFEVFKGDTAASSSSVAIVHYTSHLVNRQTGASIDWDKETYAMNRTTGVAANCCGETPRMSGETLKFPFGTRKATYQLWDPSANRAFPVRYSRTEDVDGVSAYVFSGSTPAVKIGTIGLPNSLVGESGQGLTPEQRFYRAVLTVWVEPTTGEVLRGEKTAKQWAENAGGTTVLELADLNVRYSDATVRFFADQARTNVRKLDLVSRWIPLIGGVLGAILLILGLALTWRPALPVRREAPVAVPA